MTRRVPHALPSFLGLLCSCLALSAVCASAQSLDTSFTASPNGPVNALRVQPDGKILVGGAFGNWNNQGGTPKGIARLNPDGSLDKTFNQIQETDGPVLAIALQADGRIVIGGEFFRVRASSTSGLTVFRRQIARLNADGTLDMTYDPNAAGAVRALAVQTDGKVLVGGTMMWQLGGGGRRGLGRLNPDGSLDTSFTADTGGSGTVHAIAVQADGKILVGGTFTGLGGCSCINLARINPDGSPDKTFIAGVYDGPYGTTVVRSIAVQADGKILVGGIFTRAQGNYASRGTRYNLLGVDAVGSLDNSFDPGATNPSRFYPAVRTIVVQADGRILVGGEFTRLGGGTGTTDRSYIGRLLADGSVDPTFNPGANSDVYTLALQPADGRIVVGGNFGLIGGGGTGFTRRSYLARLNNDGLAQPDTVVDPSYNPGAGPAGAEVLALGVQADGKTVVGGTFSMLGGGGTGTTTRNRVGRLNGDGSLDTAFNPGANGNVHALLVQPDGKIVVGGAFTTLGGGGTGTTTRNGGIGRLNADGSIDTTFNPNKAGYVNTLARQADGKIIGGGAMNWGGYIGPGGSWLTIDWIGRLNANGSVDSTFAPGADDIVFAVAVQPADGKIVVGGRFSRLGGGGSGVTTRRKIGRLNANGSIDTSFDPGANSEVYALAVQADGKILVGGNFQAIGGGGIGTGATPRNFIARLNANGSVDTTFNPGADGPAYSLVVQPDGKILVGGAFHKLGGGGAGTTTREHLGRLNADGSIDESFNPGADGNVKAFGVQADGKVVVAGGFTKMGGGGSGDTARSHLARLMFASAPSGYMTASVPAGATQPVTVQTPAGGVDVTLSPVTTPGNVTVQTQQVNQSSMAQAPQGFKLLLWITFDVKTTAAFGTANLCIPYALVDVVTARLKEASLRLFYVPGDGSSWVDVTTSLNTAAKQVCGSTTHLSTFAIAGQEAVVSRYLAEGASTSFFDTRLALLNPGTTAATATLTFARKGTTNLVATLPVPASSRVSLDPETISGMSEVEFSTKVESDQLLVVDRTMSWDSRGYGAHAETAVVSPAPTWYLAEGSTNGFNLFYLLQNPNDTKAEVLVRYLRLSGAPLEKTYTLDENSRTNIWVNQESFGGLGKALSSIDVSAVIEVTNQLDIIVERAMYLDAPGQFFGAGHESAGVTEAATQWFLAEGATWGGFDLFILIANPSATEAEIEATYLLTDGTVIVRPYKVAGNSRFNIWVNLEEARLARAAMSTTIRSVNDVPIIVERAMWWPSGGWYEAHNSAGATMTGTQWALAEGEVEGTRGVATYILVANTSESDAGVKVTVFCENGPTLERTFPVLAHSRFNVDVGYEFPGAVGYRFGAIVESVGVTPAQIVVERAMYWNAMGQTWAAGTNALATRLR